MFASWLGSPPTLIFPFFPSILSLFALSQPCSCDFLGLKGRAFPSNKVGSSFLNARLQSPGFFRTPSVFSAGDRCSIFGFCSRALPLSEGLLRNKHFPPGQCAPPSSDRCSNCERLSLSRETAMEPCSSPPHEIDSLVPISLVLDSSMVRFWFPSVQREEGSGSPILILL